MSEFTQESIDIITTFTCLPFVLIFYMIHYHLRWFSVNISQCWRAVEELLANKISHTKNPQNVCILHYTLYMNHKEEQSHRQPLTSLCGVRSLLGANLGLLYVLSSQKSPSSLEIRTVFPEEANPPIHISILTWYSVAVKYLPGLILLCNMVYVPNSNLSQLWVCLWILQVNKENNRSIILPN